MRESSASFRVMAKRVMLYCKSASSGGSAHRNTVRSSGPGLLACSGFRSSRVRGPHFRYARIKVTDNLSPKAVRSSWPGLLACIGLEKGNKAGGLKVS